MTKAPKTGYAQLAGPDIFGIVMRGKLSATDYDRLASIADEYRRILRTHILPAIGGKPSWTCGDVARLHAGLVRTPYEANRTLAVVVRRPKQKAA